MNRIQAEITSQRIKASIQLFNRIREKLGEIYTRRRKGLTPWPGRFFAQIIRAGYLLDRERYLELLNELLNALPEKTEESENLDSRLSCREYGSFRIVFFPHRRGGCHGRPG